jgi:hypothetical protein
VSETLDEARDRLREQLNEGAKCPCCTQFAKVYRRKINSGMARALVKMWDKAGMEWVYTPRLCPWTHEVGQLSWWDLIEDSRDRRDDGGRAGWWRITSRGRRFVLNQSREPKYAHIYDGRLISLDNSETVNIVEALGARFDYRALMES